jgi:hypothetical protein
MPRSSSWRSARAIGVSTRCAILDRDDCRCVYCGVELEVRGAHLDHLKPRHAGGPSTPDNLVTACAGCNNARQHGRILLTSRALARARRPLNMQRGRELARQHYPGRFKVAQWHGTKTAPVSK